MAAGMLIVEDHELLAQTLAEALKAEGFDTHVVIPDSGAEVLDAARAVRPAIVLLDLHLGFALGNGLGLVRPLADEGMQVVVLTADSDPVHTATAVTAGASGVVHKSRPFDELVEALAAIGNGQPPVILPDHGEPAEDLAEGFSTLTPREEEVLAGLAAGKTAQDIADEFTVAVATVRAQIASVRAKLGAPNQLAAASLALRSGWTPTHGRAPTG